MQIPEIQTQTAFIRHFISNILVKGADTIDKGRLFSCQFLAVIMNSSLLLTHIADATCCFLNSNFSCSVFCEVTELLVQKVEIWHPSHILIPSEGI